MIAYSSSDFQRIGPEADLRPKDNDLGNESWKIIGVAKGQGKVYIITTDTG
jgi:hypothetical protein